MVFSCLFSANKWTESVFFNGVQLFVLCEQMNGGSVYFNGVHLFFLYEQMNKIFRQSDIWEVLGLYAFVIGPLGKGLPLRVINVPGRISEEDRLPYPRQCLWSDAVSGYPGLMSMRLDPTAQDLCGTEGVECWGCIGIVLRRSAVWEDADLSCSSNRCHGRDGCWEAARITVVPWESLIFWRVLGTMGAGGKTYTRPKPWQDMERASTTQALSSG